MNQNLIIGGGAMGLFLALNLLENNEKVILITNNKLSDSVSYNYPLGINIGMNLNLKNYKYYDLNNNYFWFSKCLLFYLQHNKKKLYESSFKIMKKYDIEPMKCKNTYLLPSEFNINKIIKILLENKNFTLQEDTYFDLLKLNDIENKYKKIYVTVGPGIKNKYTKKVAGFRVDIESKLYPKCLMKENGLFITTIQKNNKYYLTVHGGYYFNDDNFYNKKLDLSFKNIENKLKESKFWNFYGCKKIVTSDIGQRSLSQDGLPFYHTKNNITFIEGGSFIGYILSPLYADYIINNNNPTNFNFHISRIEKKEKIFNLFIKLFIILLILLLFYLSK